MLIGLGTWKKQTLSSQINARTVTKSFNDKTT